MGHELFRQGYAPFLPPSFPRREMAWMQVGHYGV